MAVFIVILIVMRFPTARSRTAVLKLTCHSLFFNKLRRVWQELEYRIDVCRVTRGAHIEHL